MSPDKSGLRSDDRFGRNRLQFNVIGGSCTLENFFSPTSSNYDK
jgi:hypothetical protein